MMELLRSLSFLKTKPTPVGSANEKELSLGEWNKAMEESNDELANKTQASNT